MKMWNFLNEKTNGLKKYKTIYVNQNMTNMNQQKTTELLWTDK